MKKLLIIRHAIAMERADFQATASGVGVDEAVNDDLRPLTDEGIKKMRRSMKGLDRLIRCPDLLATSPLTRALQTTEILRQTWLGLDAKICQELRPDAKPAQLLEWLQKQSFASLDNALVAVVGHEPLLSSLVAFLTSKTDKPFIELKKGGACLIEFEDGWKKSSGRLVWLATPAMFKR